MSQAHSILTELKFWMLTSVRDSREAASKPLLLRNAKHLAARLREPAQAIAEASVRHQRQVEVLEKNIRARGRGFFPADQNKEAVLLCLCYWAAGCPAIKKGRMLTSTTITSTWRILA
jgi:hypothetical protein